MHAAAEARKLFSMEQALGAYMPHLSLLYGDLPDADRDRAASQAHARLYGEGAGWGTLLIENGFAVDSISLWCAGETRIVKISGD